VKKSDGEAIKGDSPHERVIISGIKVEKIAKKW